MSIKAHIYDTLVEANEAISTINSGEGIPINEDAITTTYTSVEENNGNIYIRADKITEKYLGPPEDLELIFDEEI
jgi:hypothetical protein